MPDKAKPKVSGVAGENDTVEFAHPANEQLLTYLKNDQLDKKGEKSQWVLDEYPLRAHPDLVDFFNHLPLAQGVKKGSAYGRPVMLNAAGLIFAWAGGTNYIYLRVPENLRQQAISQGGRWDRSYGEDWVEFVVWKARWGATVDWEEALTRWMQLSYEQSLKI